MRIPRIFTSKSLSLNEAVHLEEQASFHLLKVLRLAIGRPIVLFNGDGNEYEATLIGANKKTATVEIVTSKPKSNESPIKIHLGQGISKGDRMDLTIQKAVELGVHEITPLWTERCDVKLKADRLEKKLNHWRGIIVSACEQSGRCALPRLNSPMTINEWVNVDAEEKLVLHHRSPTKLDNGKGDPGSIMLTVGSEGGLSEGEISLLEQHHFRSVAFGPRILRTETAALTAISVIQATWGDFR